MNERTKVRLDIIASRFGQRRDPSPDATQAWLDAYEERRTGVLRTAMIEIAEVLSRGGHRSDVVLDVEPELRSIDLVIAPWGAEEEARRVRFFVRRSEGRGHQIVAHVWLSQSPAEMTRFEHPGEVTADVAEQLLVDAIEQIFASAASRARRMGVGA
ncbi:MAG: hypothetical protein U0441_09425 [Polyangiaceae bacterium]